MKISTEKEKRGKAKEVRDKKRERGKWRFTRRIKKRKKQDDED